MANEEFKKRLQDKLDESRKEFEGKYKDQLKDLMGLSKEEISEITPDLVDIETYNKIIIVVKEASRANLSAVALKKNIEELGKIAVKIAKKVPSLAAII